MRGGSLLSVPLLFVIRSAHGRKVGWMSGLDAIARRLFYAVGALSSIIDSQRVAAAAAAGQGSLCLMAIARRHTAAHLDGYSVLAFAI